MGCEGGLVFTASHELIHSRRASERLLGDALLASMFYMHWYVYVFVVNVCFTCIGVFFVGIGVF